MGEKCSLPSTEITETQGIVQGDRSGLQFLGGLDLSKLGWLLGMLSVRVEEVKFSDLRIKQGTKSHIFYSDTQRMPDFLDSWRQHAFQNGGFAKKTSSVIGSNVNLCCWLAVLVVKFHIFEGASYRTISRTIAVYSMCILLSPHRISHLHIHFVIPCIVTGNVICFSKLNLTNHFNLLTGWWLTPCSTESSNYTQFLEY